MANEVETGHFMPLGGIALDLVEFVCTRSIAPRAAVEAALAAPTSELDLDDASAVVRILVSRGVLGGNQAGAVTEAFVNAQKAALEELLTRGIAAGLVTGENASAAIAGFSDVVLTASPADWLVQNGLVTDFQISATLMPDRGSTHSPQESFNSSTTASASAPQPTLPTPPIRFLLEHPTVIALFVSTLVLSRISFSIGSSGALDGAWPPPDVVRVLLFGGLTRVLCPSLLVVGLVAASRTVSAPSVAQLIVGTSLLFGEPVLLVESGGQLGFLGAAVLGMVLVRRGIGGKVNSVFWVMATGISLAVVSAGRSAFSTSLALELFNASQPSGYMPMYVRVAAISSFWNVVYASVVALALTVSLQESLAVKSTLRWYLRWITTPWSLYPVAWILGVLSVMAYKATISGYSHFVPPPAWVGGGVAIFLVIGSGMMLLRVAMSRGEDR